MSIMGNATRYSAANTPDIQQIHGINGINGINGIHGTKCTLVPAQRMTVESQAPQNASSQHQPSGPSHSRGRSLQDILDAVYDSKVCGVEELSKWIRSNHRDCLDADNLSVIRMALSGLFDSVSMNKGSVPHEDQLIDATVQCITNLILFGSSSLTMQDVIRLLSKLLRLFIKPNGEQYQRSYAKYSGYFQAISKALTATTSESFSFKSVVMALCETILKPKQKLVWCHFLAIYGKHCPSGGPSSSGHDEALEEWNSELILYLFRLLRDCVMNPLFIEFHAFFRSAQCVMVEDVLKYIVTHHAHSYHEVFIGNVDDTMIETLLGMVQNPMIARILQKHHSSAARSSANAPSSSSRTPRLSMSSGNAPNSSSTFTTPMHQNKRYQSIRKQQIESMATPPLNMYMTTPAPIAQKNNPHDPSGSGSGSKQNPTPSQSHHSQHPQHPQHHLMADHNEKENELQIVNMNDEQLIDVLLTKNKQFIKSIVDEKNALKLISHRINDKKAIFDEKCAEILAVVIAVMNSDRFVLHRNALRILQAICWFYPKRINEQLERTLLSIVHLFRANAPSESGELALDVITQFCKVAHCEQCIGFLLPIIQREIEQNGGSGNGRKVYAALCIFDRVVVLAPTQWLRERARGFAKLLVSAYRYHREPMRSLIYLSIILEGDTSFLEGHHKEQRIVEMMAKEADFADWVRSHRVAHCQHT